MDWSDGVVLAAVCLIGGAIALCVRQQFDLARQIRAQGVSLPSTQYLASKSRDWYTAAVFGALLILCSTTVLHQMERGAPAQEMMLSLAAIAGSAFACGAAFGRLLLRRELRQGN